MIINGSQVIARHRDNIRNYDMAVDICDLRSVDRGDNSTAQMVARAIDHHQHHHHQLGIGHDVSGRQAHSSSNCSASSNNSLQQNCGPTNGQQQDDSKQDSVLSCGQQSDENSTGSWSANSLNCGASGSSRKAIGAGGDGDVYERRLSVILPSNQKSLLTPTIAMTNEQGATPNQLFSSLIQLNGQEVGLFTGLPSCTPTSADGLARAGINPFFWGVQQQQQQQLQKSPNVDSLNQNNLSDIVVSNEHPIINNGNSLNQIHSTGEQTSNKSSTDDSCSKSTLENKERRRQLSKLSIDQLQAANAMILNSPLTSFLLSPENEAWLRLNLQQNHPLSGKTAQSSSQQQQQQLQLQPQQLSCYNHHQQQQQQQATEQAVYALGIDNSGLQHPVMSTPYVNHMQHPGQQQIQPRTNPQDLTSNHMIALRLNDGPTINQTQAPISSQPTQIINTISPQYNNATSSNNSYNAPITTTSSSNSFLTGSQQHQLASATKSPDFVSNSSRLIYQQPQNIENQLQTVQPSATEYAHSKPTTTTTTTTNVIVPSNTDQRNKIATVRTPILSSSSLTIENSNNERGCYVDVTQNSMGPPAAHHHQQVHNHHQGSHLLIMGAHHLDPRFVEFQQHHPNSLEGYDGAKGASISLYEPHQLQQLFLAQKHQQEIYNLHQQHNQKQYLNYQQQQQQQQVIPSYHLMPNGQAQHQQQQQQLLPQSQPAPTTGYRSQTESADHDDTIMTGSVTKNCPVDEQNAHQGDMSSSSNSTSLASSANVSPRRQEHSSQLSCNNTSSISSARSSVSRDANSIDVIATSGSIPLDGCNKESPIIHKPQAKAKQSTNSKQQATRAVIKKSEENSKLTITTTSNGDGIQVVKKKSKGGRKKKIVTNEELLARKNRSKERNRVAAKRCRQKRKQFLDELRGKIDNLNDLNRKLLKENNQLKGELEQLKKHHKVCVAN